MSVKNKKESANKGITLVALVVTIVVLLILAGITIMYVMGDNSIFKLASDAKTNTEQAKEEEKAYLEGLGSNINDYVSGNVTRVPIEDIINEKQNKNTYAKDSYGNPITVPAGFKIVPDSGEKPAGSTESDAEWNAKKVEYSYVGDDAKTPSVQDGIVIEDEEGNQFVWIPVGDIKNKEGDPTKIELARHIFNIGTYDSSTKTYNGTGAIEQTKTDGGLLKTSSSASYGYLEEDANSTSTYKNAKAKNIGEFISKTKANGGYYLARYEASYGSGYKSSGTDSEKYENAKPLSKPSTNSANTMNYRQGTLWNVISQPNASKVAQNMYKGNKDVKGRTVGVESDLINSYAWDTAIVFIQAYSGENAYSKQTSKNKSLANTGINNDKVCNIHDMASNCREWTTETYTSSGIPCAYMGGSYASINNYTAYRYGVSASGNDMSTSFRPLLYVQ